MLAVFWVYKTVHEFAHAFAVKVWGGEVHEMGITLLVLAPVPYVDASAAWSFRDRHKRAGCRRGYYGGAVPWLRLRCLSGCRLSQGW